VVLPLSEALLQLTLWNSQQQHSSILFYLLCVLKSIPFSIFTFGNRSHTRLYLVKRGAATLVEPDASPRSSTQDGTSGWGHCHGAVAYQLTSTTQVTCTALHHTDDGELQRRPLVNSLTIWCILMVNEAFVIKDNCQHHFRLAPNLVCFSGFGDPTVSCRDE
jgi:hypothetical protein